MYSIMMSLFEHFEYFDQVNHIEHVDWLMNWFVIRKVDIVMCMKCI